MAPKVTETRRRAGQVPTCDHPEPDGGKCGATAPFGFDIAGQIMAPTPAERWACLAHKVWGENYWRTINGKA